MRTGYLPFLVGRRAVSWISNNLKHFNPFIDSNLSENLRHQALCELALLYLILHRNSRFREMQETRRIASFLQNVCSDSFFKTSFGRWNHAVIPVAIFSAVCVADGRPLGIEEYGEIQRFILNSNACGVERVPYRQLELRHAVDLGGFACDLPTYEDLWARTMLGHRPNLMFLSDDDVYSFTHTIFYLTDFSTRAISFLSYDDISHIHSSISVLIGLYIRRNNLDILGELLAAERCIKRKSRFSLIGWKVLHQSQRDGGRLDGPYRQCNSSGSAEQIFQDNYHTTLVAGLAGAIWSQYHQS